MVKGYIHTLTLTPKNPNTHIGITIIHAYIINKAIKGSSGERISRWKAAANQLRETLTINPSPISIAIGDFNFAIDPLDRTGPPRGETIEFKEALKEFLGHHNMEEVCQPDHTYHHNHEGNTSKLDRAYCTGLDSILANNIPCLRVRPRPVDKDGKPISKHLPISLTYTKNKQRDTIRIYDEEIDDNLVSDFIDGYDKLKGYNGRPFDKLEDSIGIVHKCIKESRKGKRKAITHQRKITVLKIALREYNDPKPSIPTLKALAKENPSLKGAITSDPKLFGRHKVKALKLLDDLYSHAITLNCTTTPKTNYYTNAIRQGKATLPSNQKRFARIERGHTTTDDPDEMTKIVGEEWSKIWQEPNLSQRQVDKVLQSIDYTLPPIDRPTDDVILEALINNKKSAPGPDGIPFSFWKKVAHNVLPMFRDIVDAIMGGASPPPFFNKARLYIFPKLQGTTNPLEARPISINNTFNRIIADVIRIVLAKAVDPWLHKSQKGFRAGSLIDDNIIDITDSFYMEDWKDEEAYYLFIDYRKCFDSIAHEFIMGTLGKLKAPKWVSNAIKALLHGITASLSINGGTATTIHIRRGVKQGCPLSPLIFNLCNNHLLVTLDNTPDIDPHAFADDTATKFTDPKTYNTIARKVTTYTKASGMSITKPKLSSSPHIATQMLLISPLASPNGRRLLLLTESHISALS